ncbi:alpha-ketoacid dehydrogenase subunit beta (plasmid) [Streptomyces sp. NBC_01136]|uniref:alpha-ketoacid dehydrogenase subunit beta n=1 Tax=unclassified Streptomyces TaxID=2593676 RepID=UPI002F91743B|nr:alpha-ketoacid dehydrogenase subunit beta [Streptomyces sp. NBC_01136]
MRVSENLNLALHELFERNETAVLLGEDIRDPYGGAFKVTKGLSTRFSERVLSTPLSEGAIVGAGAGLALAGDTAVVEIMFGDFITLGFDQIVNFASKSVSMYGRRVPLRLVVRCPVGGGRGYGPTHSQSPQKHFVGVPDLGLFELSPFHDSRDVLQTMLARETPGILFEDKVLYTQQMYEDGSVDDLFGYDFIDGDPPVARVFIERPDVFDQIVIAPGGMANRALAAMRTAFLEEETVSQLLVPSQLYPFDVEPLLPTLAQARQIVIVEEGVAGGTWGSEVAQSLYPRLWGSLRRPIRLVHSADSIIPTAAHLEREVLVQDKTIREALAEAAND